MGRDARCRGAGDAASGRAWAGAGRRREVEQLVATAATWAAARSDVVALALVGSWVRGEARADSDVDLVLLTHDPARYTAADDWALALGAPGVTRTASWGAITERRIVLPSGLEVEVGVGRPSWASTAPLDAGTARVVADGLRALHDPSALLTRLVEHVRRSTG